MKSNSLFKAACGAGAAVAAAAQCSLLPFFTAPASAAPQVPMRPPVMGPGRPGQGPGHRPGQGPGRNSHGSMSWSGSVDDTAEFAITGRNVRIRSNAKGVHSAHYTFTSALPRDDVRVRITNKRGRGSVDVIEQPSRRNGYTAVIRIRDPQSSRGRYTFNVEW